MRDTGRSIYVCRPLSEDQGEPPSHLPSNLTGQGATPERLLASQRGLDIQVLPRRRDRHENIARTGSTRPLALPTLIDMYVLTIIVASLWIHTESIVRLR